MYVLSKLKVYIHIPNARESIIEFAWRQVTQGYTCIFISFRQNSIYIKQNIYKIWENECKWKNH